MNLEPQNKLYKLESKLDYFLIIEMYNSCNTHGPANFFKTIQMKQQQVKKPKASPFFSKQHPPITVVSQSSQQVQPSSQQQLKLVVQLKNPRQAKNINVANVAESINVAEVAEVPEAGEQRGKRPHRGMVIAQMTHTPLDLHLP